MNALSFVDRLALERLLGMGSGYVLNFSNRTFADFVGESTGIDVYKEKYEVNGTSKANRLRAFLQLESPATVAKLLNDLLVFWEHEFGADAEPSERRDYDTCLGIVRKICDGASPQPPTEQEFLHADYGGFDLNKLELAPSIAGILQSRIAEAVRCRDSNACLATVFLCGSVLEGALLGVAKNRPEEFNRATSAPKQEDGKTKPFGQWKLAEFIDVAYDLGYLGLDVKKFSHVLRDFRNYIHPYEELRSEFKPDQHTADICMQVLKAAIASLCAKERN